VYFTEKHILTKEKRNDKYCSTHLELKPAKINRNFRSISKRGSKKNLPKFCPLPSKIA